MSEHDIYRQLGRLSRRITQLEERQDEQMTEVDYLTQSVTQLKNDISAKFGEIDAAVSQIEKEKSEGKPADLSGLKALVDEADKLVKDHQLPTAAPASGGEPASGGTGGEPSGTTGAALPKQSVYVHAGEGEVDEAQWPKVPFETDEASPRQLYYYAGDTAGAVPFTTAGVGATGWELWSGNVKATA